MEGHRLMEIHVVPDEYGACPRCGAYWGHPDKSLDFPNRNKVDQYWRCYNPHCTAGYYDPATQQVVEDKPSPEEEAAINKKVHDEVEAMMKGMRWETVDHGNGMTTSRLVPE